MSEALRALGSSRHSGFIHASELLGFLALSAYALGLGVAPALPGLAVGQGHWIERVRLSAAGLAQLSALGFCFVAARLLVELALTRPSTPLRTWLMASTGIVISAVAVATPGALGLANIWFAALVVASGSSALVAASYGLRSPDLRAPSLIVCTAAGAGLVHGAARYWAVASGIDADVVGYTGARFLATVAWVFELMATVLAFAWLVAGRPGALLTSASALAVGACSAIAWNLGPQSAWLKLAQRAAGYLSLSPEPLIPPFLRAAETLIPLALCGLLLFARHRPGWVRLVVVLALVARTKLDSPLGALFELTAALLLLSAAPLGHGSRPDFVQAGNGRVSQ